MDLDPLVEWTGVGVVFLLNLGGALALVLPGRLRPALAESAGLGRRVEALLILSALSTIYFAGLGNVPVYIDENGVVSFSLIGAIVPTILSAHFLVRNGLWRALAALVGIAACSAAAFAVSHPEPELGIVASYPAFLLPSVTGALAGILIAPGSLRAIPLAYACASTGALVGADLIRTGWVVTTPKPVGGSFGGAEVFDLVFLAGLWAAALAALPLAGRRLPLERDPGPWRPVADLAAAGRSREAVVEGTRLVTQALSRWADARGLAGAPPDQVRRASFAEPVLAQVEAAIRLGPLLTPALAKPLLEHLEALHRRLERPRPPNPAVPSQRAAAGLIDLLVPLGAAGVAAVLVPPAPVAPVAYFVLSVAVTTHIVYPFLAEWLFGGATLGKATLGLRVRRLDGGPPTAWDALVRNLGRLLDLPMLYLIALVAPTDAGGQRLGDYFAGTVVSDVRAAATSSAVTAAPTATPTTAQR